MTYKASPAAIELIKRFEGCRLSAYRDAVGVCTIGYGGTSGVREGMVISQEQADERLEADVCAAAECVDRKVNGHLTQPQFDALVSFVFNLGCSAFAGSTLLRLINCGRTDLAAEEFPKWCHAGNRVLPGLLARRQAERSLFLS